MVQLVLDHARHGGHPTPGGRAVLNWGHAEGLVAGEAPADAHQADGCVHLEAILYDGVLLQTS